MQFDVMVQCLNSTFGTYWFHLAVFGSKEGSFGVFCFVLLEEWSVRERSSTGLASASPHGCFTPDQIKTLSGICLCLGQTSLCPFRSGSSLPHWPWTMSVRPVAYLFISVNDSGRKLQESQESHAAEGAGRCQLCGIPAWLCLAALLSGVVSTHQHLLKVIDACQNVL